MYVYARCTHRPLSLLIFSSILVTIEKTVSFCLMEHLFLATQFPPPPPNTSFPPIVPFTQKAVYRHT